jgi:hypothetical protein
MVRATDVSFMTSTSVVGLAHSPVHLMLVIVSPGRGELLGRKSSGSGLENRKYGLGISRSDYATPCIHKSWH